MATVYELKTMSHGYQMGNSKYFYTREEAEQARKDERAADQAYRKFSLSESGYDPGISFRYYIREHKNGVLWGIHPGRKSA